MGCEENAGMMPRRALQDDGGTPRVPSSCGRDGADTLIGREEL